VLDLNAEHGEHLEVPLVAVIDEQTCIGCTLCIQACPVDAILGAAKQMHTVIADECTGCKLCLPPCPVDCIDMVPAEQSIDDWKWLAPSDPLELVQDA
jgi:electron transport complex protein RnfB